MLYAENIAQKRDRENLILSLFIPLIFLEGSELFGSLPLLTVRHTVTLNHILFKVHVGTLAMVYIISFNYTAKPRRCQNLLVISLFSIQSFVKPYRDIFLMPRCWLIQLNLPEAILPAASERDIYFGSA